MVPSIGRCSLNVFLWLVWISLFPGSQLWNFYFVCRCHEGLKAEFVMVVDVDRVCSLVFGVGPVREQHAVHGIMALEFLLLSNG